MPTEDNMSLTEEIKELFNTWFSEKRKAFDTAYQELAEKEGHSYDKLPEIVKDYMFKTAMEKQLRKELAEELTKILTA